MAGDPGAIDVTAKSRLGAILRSTSGNFLEMFDFFLFGIYANHIAKAFFPSENEFASLMAAFMSFAAGFLMRPVGALVLCAYIDRIGRRKGLILTLGIMALGTVLIAFVPSYATIGVAAPLLVLAGRLLQGFSAGVELGGVSVYLAEIATPGHKGFYVSWQSGSQQVAVVFVALLGVLLSAMIPPDQMMVWGWRIPFLIGCLIIPLLFILRRSLKETEEFEKRRGAADRRDGCEVEPGGQDESAGSADQQPYWRSAAEPLAHDWRKLSRGRQLFAQASGRIEASIGGAGGGK